MLFQCYFLYAYLFTYSNRDFWLIETYSCQKFASILTVVKKIMSKSVNLLTALMFISQMLGALTLFTQNPRLCLDCIQTLSPDVPDSTISKAYTNCI